MKTKLTNFLMNDGSRHFLSLPENVNWGALQKIIKSLKGAEITDYVSDNIIEMWLDFNFKNQKFTINNQYGEYWIFVENADCPELKSLPATGPKNT